ncbi:MAG TPA: aminotransferase class IV [Gemmataceae bacterium]|nr:aminotransferase class IV [Gemmataceae bacterium]
MPQPLAYFQGRFQPAVAVGLALHDAGFVMGATVTDLCRTVRHRLYRWDDHLARFHRSCELTHITPPIADEEITRLAQELVAHNAALVRPTDDLALVLFATPGPIGFYAGLEGGVGDAPPTLGMHTFPLPFARYRRLFSEGAHLAVPHIKQIPANCVDPRIKQRSRLHWWHADREIHAAFPGAAAVLLNEHNHLTETASANLLIVKNGVVQSPPREMILGGISLLTVEELCRELGVAFVERPLMMEDAQEADEMMLSCTSYCLCGVSKFNGATVPWPGAVFQRLLSAWGERIGLDIRAQVESCDSS